MRGPIRIPEDERDECRWLFSDWYGLTYADVRPEDVLALEGLLCVAYALRERDEGRSPHLRPASSRRDATRVETDEEGRVRCARVRCDGGYFRGREAISLNPGGFIGVAGWADDSNVRPFATAFKAWVMWWLAPRAAGRADDAEGDEDGQG